MEASFEAVDAVVDTVEDLRDLRVLGTASAMYHQSTKVCHIDGDSSFFSTGFHVLVLGEKEPSISVIWSF